MYDGGSDVEWKDGDDTELYDKGYEEGVKFARGQWRDGYTSALANAREHGYVTEEQYNDLYTEVL